MKILFVDDETIITDLAATILAEFDLKIANSATDAQHYIMTEDFDVIICDMCMPGVTGESLTKSIIHYNQNYKGKIIAMTGGGRGSDMVERLLKDGYVTHVLMKPFTMDSLLVTVFSLT